VCGTVFENVEGGCPVAAFVGIVSLEPAEEIAIEEIAAKERDGHQVCAAPVEAGDCFFWHGSS
jgi:hypothetical protein